MALTFDPDSLTLGEMVAVEAAGGEDFPKLWAAGLGMKLLIAAYVNELRTSEQPRSWNELSSLRLLDVSSSTSRASRAGRPVKSAA